jgi:HD-GYP domain-containing protein (c-di-GMP phosphodiesterase class II)
MLDRLSRAIEARDPHSEGHSERVTRLAVVVAERLGWSDEEIETLQVGGALHDIGKVAVSRQVLCKPASLTPEEREEVEVHPSVGAALVERWPLASEAVPYVLCHHERWDGCGYPRGLAQDEIPLGARLLGIADAFDAMTSTRAYREALPVDAACAELVRCAGTQFDPDLVEAFLAAWSPAGQHAVSV